MKFVKRRKTKEKLKNCFHTFFIFLLFASTLFLPCCGKAFNPIIFISPNVSTNLSDFNLKPSELSNIVSRSTVHDGGAKVKFTSSPLLWTLGKLYQPLSVPRLPKHVIESGGLCSERSWVLVSLLTDFGVPARLVGLSGHVVAEAVQDGKWIVLDPDYGFVFSHDLKYLESNPSVFDDYKFETEEIKSEYIRIFTTIDDNKREKIGKNASPRLMILILIIVYFEKISFIFIIVLCLIYIYRCIFYKYTVAKQDD